MTTATTTIRPGVAIDGQTVYPPGWAWVLAFALRGVPWAVAEALKPEFDATVKAHFREYNRKCDMEDIAELEQQIADIKAKWGMP